MSRNVNPDKRRALTTLIDFASTALKMEMSLEYLEHKWDKNAIDDMTAWICGRLEGIEAIIKDNIPMYLRVTGQNGKDIKPHWGKEQTRVLSDAIRKHFTEGK